MLPGRGWAHVLLVLRQHGGADVDPVFFPIRGTDAIADVLAHALADGGADACADRVAHG